MPSMTDVQSVAANTTVPNVLAGKTNEFLSENSVIRVGAVGSAVGLFFSLLIGDVVVVQDQEMSGANRFPIDPDDMIIDDVGEAGDRLVLSVRNSTAGALTSNIVVKVIPA